jgi:hypothetical protein
VTTWRDLLADQARARSHDTQKRSRGASDSAHISRVGYSAAVHPYIVRAARQRGISISGYIRRASLALAAMDLGLEVVDLFGLDAAVTPIGRIGAKPSKDLDGTLYGRWEVMPRDAETEH